MIRTILTIKVHFPDLRRVYFSKNKGSQRAPRSPGAQRFLVICNDHHDHYHQHDHDDPPDHHDHCDPHKPGKHLNHLHLDHHQHHQAGVQQISSNVQ